MVAAVGRVLIDHIRRAAHPLGELDSLARSLSPARVVLLGEATHGTHEFYAVRAELTKKLIEEHGFSVVAIEADWPDALALYRWVRGEMVGNELEAISTFRRFPGWMWRNAETAEFLAWLRKFNLSRTEKVGIYGLDLYSASSSSRGSLDGVVPGEEFFLEEQNARLMRNASQYFRAVRSGYPSSWNLRDRHMAETLDALLGFLKKRAVVWAHNSHVGDARATQLSDSGELSLGQLVREKYSPAEVKLVGFTTHRGTVIAAHEWAARPSIKTVRPSLPESFEALMHRARIPRFWLNLSDHGLKEALAEPRLERAIGAVYVQEAELENHYFQAELSKQFDALVHIDETRALEPIDSHEITPWSPLL